MHSEDALMKSQNFEFLRRKHPELADLGGFAEAYARPDPAGALVKLRSFIEGVVAIIYETYRLPRPYTDSIFDLLNETPFRAAVPDVVLGKLHTIRKCGNKATHHEAPSAQVALQGLRDSFDIAQWVFLRIDSGHRADCPAYREPPAAAATDSAVLQKEKKEALLRSRRRHAARPPTIAPTTATLPVLAQHRPEGHSCLAPPSSPAVTERLRIAWLGKGAPVFPVLSLVMPASLQPTRELQWCPGDPGKLQSLATDLATKYAARRTVLVGFFDPEFERMFARGTGVCISIDERFFVATAAHEFLKVPKPFRVGVVALTTAPTRTLFLPTNHDHRGGATVRAWMSLGLSSRRRTRATWAAGS